MTVYFYGYYFQICSKHSAFFQSPVSKKNPHYPLCYTYRKMSSQFCQEILSHAGHKHSAAEPKTFCQVSTQTGLKVLTVFCLKRAIQEPHKPRMHAYSTKSPCSSNPHSLKLLSRTHMGSAAAACLPVALVSSECWTRPWYRAPTYHASLPVRSHAALPGSCLPLPPSLRLNLILAAAKHFHQKLSDWRGAVS